MSCAPVQVRALLQHPDVQAQLAARPRGFDTALFQVLLRIQESDWPTTWMKRLNDPTEDVSAATLSCLTLGLVVRNETGSICSDLIWALKLRFRLSHVKSGAGTDCVALRRLITELYLRAAPEDLSTLIYGLPLTAPDCADIMLDVRWTPSLPHLSAMNALLDLLSSTSHL
jgi:hypothetical protein